MQSKPTGEENSILVKLLSNDAPQIAMSYILMQVANREKIHKQNGKAHYGRTTKLPFSPP